MLTTVDRKKSPPSGQIDTSLLKKWFFQNRRDLPWRSNPSPYQVWISEIMLQQTRVVAAIPYYKQWMQQFPDIETLAKAPTEVVIKAWEGLGYYSRARNIHRTSIEVMEKFTGQMPSNRKDLESLPGIGPYTAGAILNFAFHKREIAIDGNIERVIARHFQIVNQIKSKEAKKQVETYMELALSDNESWVVLEALIELGALICDKDPKCSECPLQDNCLSNLHGNPKDFPIKPKRDKIIALKREVAVVFYNGKVLVRKNSSGIMADLYEFPYLEKKEGINPLLLFEKDLNIKLEYKQDLSQVIHHFTKYKVKLLPSIYEASEVDSGFLDKFYSINEIHQYPFSSGHRKVLSEVIEYLEREGCSNSGSLV